MADKIAYKYDPVTFVAGGSEVIQESPLQPGVWLWPPHVTTDVPPVPEVGKTTVFLNGQWRSVISGDVPGMLPEHDAALDREYMIVSRFQAKAAMLAAGMLPSVEAYFSGSASALDKLAWSDVTNFYRLSPLVVATGAALKMTDADLDRLFIAAAAIEI